MTKKEMGEIIVDSVLSDLLRRADKIMAEGEKEAWKDLKGNYL